jgi:hypothetical protein
MKLQLTLDENAYNTLVSLQKASDASSLAEVLRNAVGLLKWARIQQANGYTVGALKDGVPVKAIKL